MTSALTPALVNRLRAAHVLDGLVHHEARIVSVAIVAAVNDCGVADRSAATALYQKSANVAAGVDLMLQGWVNGAAMSAALAAAADVLAP